MAGIEMRQLELEAIRKKFIATYRTVFETMLWLDGQADSCQNSDVTWLSVNESIIKPGL